MKKKMKYCLLGLLGLLMAACDKEEGYSVGDMAVDLVTVHVEGNGVYSFTGDTWGTLFPAASQIPWYTPKTEGERAILRFNPLYDDYYGYDVGIKAEAIYPLLTKTVEVMTEEDEAEYADHPAYLGEVWISGGYLNMELYQKMPERNKHRVSLVHRDTEPVVAEDGYVHLEFRYNTYGDTLGVVRPNPGLICYNLNTVPQEGAAGIKLRVRDAVKGEQTLVFKANESERVQSIDRVMDVDAIEVR